MELDVKAAVSHAEARRAVRKIVGIAKVAVIAIVVLLACPHAYAWAYEVDMYALDLPSDKACRQ